VDIRSVTLFPKCVFQFSSFICGYLADRFGGKNVLGVAVIWWSIFTAVTPASTHNLFLLLATRALMGLGEGVAVPAVMNLVAHWSNAKDRTLFTTAATCGGVFGSFLAQLITPPMIIHFGWRSVFYFGASLGVLWCMFYFLLVTDDPKLNSCLLTVHPRELDYLSSKSPPMPKIDRVPWNFFSLIQHAGVCIFLHLP